MASPPSIKSLLLALRWERYTAVPAGGPRKYLDPSVCVTSTPILRGSSQKKMSEPVYKNDERLNECSFISEIVILLFFMFMFMFMHLADAFIQSDLQAIKS